MQAFKPHEETFTLLLYMSSWNVVMRMTRMEVTAEMVSLLLPLLNFRLCTGAWKIGFPVQGRTFPPQVFFHPRKKNMLQLLHPTQQRFLWHIWLQWQRMPQSSKKIFTISWMVWTWRATVRLPRLKNWATHTRQKYFFLWPCCKGYRWGKICREMFS